MARRLKIPGRLTYRMPHSTGTTAANGDAMGNHGRWWDIEDEDKARACALDCWRLLISCHTTRLLKDALHQALYDGEPPYWLGSMVPGSPLLYQASSTIDGYTKARANVIRRCVDTAASMIAKNVVQISCLTDGGSWRLQKKARQRSKFINGLLREMDFHSAQQWAFVDGMLTRSGGMVKLWIDRENKTIRCGRRHCTNFAWNEAEGRNLRNLYECTPTSRDELRLQFSKMAKEIDGAKASEYRANQAYKRLQANDTIADMVDLYDCYHLGISAEKPGRRILALNNVTLVDEPWELSKFPYPRFCWDNADTGWQGRPASDTLIGYHYEVGKTMRKIARGQSLACIPRVSIELGSEVQEDELTNEIGGVMHHRGNPPVFGPASAFPPEVYHYLDWLIEQAMADVGINQMQSQGLKPAGIDAAVAIREYNDVGNTRQITKGQRLERQTEDAAEIIMYLGSKLAKEDKAFSVQALGAGSYNKIAWSDVNGDDNDIRIHSDPVSALPSTTAGKIQTVTDLIKGGLLPPEEVQGGLALKLLNFPDLEKIITMETANRELAEMQVDLALYEGKYLAPEPYQSSTGLKLLKTLACRQYFVALGLDDVPPKHMDLLRRLMSEADSLDQRLQAPAQTVAIDQPIATPPPPARPMLQQSEIAPPIVPSPGAPGGEPMPAPTQGGPQ